MTTEVLRFIALSDEDRKGVGRLEKLGADDQIEVCVRRHGGGEETLSLPSDAAALIKTLLGHLLEGDRVAVLIDVRN